MYLKQKTQFVFSVTVLSVQNKQAKQAAAPPAVTAGLATTP